MKKRKGRSRYQPTEEGLQRETHVIIMLLGNAHRQLDKLGIPKANEETSAGSSWEAARTEAEHERDKGS